MELKYSNERAVQILVLLLKYHNIRKIVASPGTTNITFVASAMHDPWFEIYSSVDERSAAYMACGLAAESGEPVVITCTGATASRNYMPGLTEAYYRKLPVLAVTASQAYEKIGHLSPQLLDRTAVPNDVVKKSFTVRAVKDAMDEWADEIAINSAILELKRHGGGPVHLNFQTDYSRDYSVKEIIPARKIERITPFSGNWPEIKGKVAIFIGSHALMNTDLTDAIDRFCGKYDAVAFCDHTSNYYGRYKVNMSLPFEQKYYTSGLKRINLLVHIGEVSGDYPGMSLLPQNVWRVNEDGEIRDTFKKLTAVFEMPELAFFNHYASDEGELLDSFLKNCEEEYDSVVSQIPELPFSNGWIAQHTAPHIPEHSTVHLGILNSLRNWNYFRFPASVRSNSNVGGFGIDGIVSTLVGASLADKDRLYFAVIGDLAFFYDMNSIGNRHVGNNVRIMLINNGKGTEFTNYNHPGAMFGEETNLFIAAAGHYGNKSPKLVRHYAEDLGFEYLTASNKDEYMKVVDKFLNPKITDKPILFEIFTDSKDESDAIELLHHSIVDQSMKTKQAIKSTLKNTIGQKGVDTLKSLLSKK